ncbi:hypothetical protein GMDG_08971, partial [Pseudogymnoascus destructans 20631-21]
PDPPAPAQPVSHRDALEPLTAPWIRSAAGDLPSPVVTVGRRQAAGTRILETPAHGVRVEPRRPSDPDIPDLLDPRDCQRMVQPSASRRALWMAVAATAASAEATAIWFNPRTTSPAA